MFSDIKYNDRYDSWFDMWLQDRYEMIHCIERNRDCDLQYGYNPTGKAIQNYNNDIERIYNEINVTINSFEGKSEKQIERICYNSLIKHGAITP